MIADKIASAAPDTRDLRPINNWDNRFKAWLLINQTAAVAAIVDTSFGVTSIVDTQVGWTAINQVTTFLLWNQVGFGSNGAGNNTILCGGNSGASQSYVNGVISTTGAAYDYYPQVAYVGSV